MAVSLPDKHSDLDLSSDSLDRSYEIINDEETGIAIGSTIVCRVGRADFFYLQEIKNYILFQQMENVNHF